MDESLKLKVGDTFKKVRSKKVFTIVNEFEYEGKTYFTFKEKGKWFSTVSKNSLETISFAYGNIWDGINEVNGILVRDKYGKII